MAKLDVQMYPSSPPSVQGGYAIFIALIGVIGLAGMLTVILPVQKDRGEYRRAYAAGSQFAMVTNAANNYVLSLSDGLPIPADNPLNPNNTPPPPQQTVDIQDLIDEGLLPPDFPDANNYGQAYRIVVTEGPPAHSTNGSTWTAAYVFTDAGAVNCDPTAGVVDTICMNDPIERTSFLAGAADYGFDILPDQFRPNSGGNNCNGLDVVVSWGTGCLNTADLATIYTGATPDDSLRHGFFIAPAWLTHEVDTDRLTRVRIPGQPGTNRMITDLTMERDMNGDSIIDPATERFDVSNMGDLTMDRLVMDNNPPLAKSLEVDAGGVGGQLTVEGPATLGALGDETQINGDVINIGNVQITTDQFESTGALLDMSVGGQLNVAGSVESLGSVNVNATLKVTSAGLPTAADRIGTVIGSNNITVENNVTLFRPAFESPATGAFTPHVGAGDVFVNDTLSIGGATGSNNEAWNRLNLTAGGIFGAGSITVGDATTPTGNVVGNSGSTVDVQPTGGGAVIISGEASAVNIEMENCSGDCPGVTTPPILPF